MANFVKFWRGTQRAYNSLITKDSDSLYFIYDNVQSEKGKLYLGNKLISDGNNSTSLINSTDLQDFAISEGLTDGQVLVYDEAEEKWVNKTINEALGVAEMVGASADKAGVSGLVPVPQAGDQDKFLKGDGSWAVITASVPENLQEKINGLISDEDAGKTIRQIAVEELTKQLIPENAKESLDTLQEIADFIQNHPQELDLSNLTARVSTLETNVGDISGLKAVMGGEETAFTSVANNLTYLNNAVEAIDDKLQWHELKESED